MTTFDTCFILVTVISALIGLFRGLVRETFSLLAWGGGYFMAMKFNLDLMDYLNDWFENETTARVLAFAFLFILTFIAVSALSFGIRSFMSHSGAMTGLDRLIGSLFGVARGIILGILLTAPLQLFPDTYSRLTKNSWAAPYLEETTDSIRELLDVKDSLLDRGLRKLKQQVPDKIPGLDKLKDISSKLQEKLSPSSSSDEKPQDDHTKEDQDKLDELVRSVTRD
ncbi:MAG: CvpA family protein [Nitrospinaceae bacterium]